MRDPWLERLNPLEKRPYKVSGWTKHFFCPLCRSERYMRTRPYLTIRNYLQIVLTSVVLVLISFPLMGAKCFFWPLFVWPAFEIFQRLQYRKELPCPYCGFDAAWYKKDVKMARKLVEDFWATKESEEAEVSLENLASEQANAKKAERPSAEY